MKKIPHKKEFKGSTFLKKEFILVNSNSKFVTYPIKIKDFYLNLFHDTLFKENDVLLIHQDDYHLELFTRLKKKIKGKKIKCLLKTKLNWFKIRLKQISENIIQILFVKKITSKDILKKINRLKQNIQKLKMQAVENNKIKNYISHYFEYNFSLEKPF